MESKKKNWLNELISEDDVEYFDQVKVGFLKINAKRLALCSTVISLAFLSSYIFIGGEYTL